MRHAHILPFYASLLASVTLLGAGCAPQPTPPAIPTPPVVIPTSTPPAPVYPEIPPLVRPRPTGNVCDPQNFICVPASLVNSHVQSPVSATGTAIAFENTFQWTLLGPTGTQIAQGTLTASAPDIGQPGAFTLSQSVTIPTGATTGTLRFYESSAKDGSPIHTLNIPVQF